MDCTVTYCHLRKPLTFDPYSEILYSRQYKSTMDFLLPVSDEEEVQLDTKEEGAQEEAEEEKEQEEQESQEEDKHQYNAMNKRLIATTIKEIRNNLHAFNEPDITVEICGAFTQIMTTDKHLVAFLDEQGMHITLRVPLDVKFEDLETNQMVTVIGKVKIVKLGPMWQQKSWIEVENIREIHDFNGLALHYLTAIYRKECENDLIATC